MRRSWVHRSSHLLFSVKISLPRLSSAHQRALAWRCPSSEGIKNCENLSIEIQNVIMPVITIRVPEELRKKMREVKLNWSEEIREFIRQRINEFEREKSIKEAMDILKNRKGVERGFSASSVRENRDRS
ncbi:MAG: hypothetical protein QXP16_06805 [Candidatus Bathyarchaeia archaeon]